MFRAAMNRIVTLLRLIALILVVTFGLLLHIRNSQPVHLDLYFLTLEQPLSILLAATLALGALLGMASAIPYLLRGRRANRRLKRELVVQTKQQSGPEADSSPASPA